jgi:hypothetical protein
VSKLYRGRAIRKPFVRMSAEDWKAFDEGMDAAERGDCEESNPYDPTYCATTGAQVNERYRMFSAIAWREAHQQVTRAIERENAPA